MYKVYFTNINELKEEFSYQEIYNKVSWYRKVKTDKMIFEKDKWLSLGAEYLLIKGLAELNIDYSKIEIGYVKNNKPILRNCPKNIYFNLSHSGEMAMCTISSYEVGCDIQKVSNNDNYLEIAKTFFHPKEFKMIESVNEEEGREIFYRIWVLKESYIKATGMGMQTKLKDYRVCFDYDKPKIIINDMLLEKLKLEERQVNIPNYKSAICLIKD